MHMPDATIIICTYNRCESLKDTLESLEGLDTHGLHVEVIVVDNNSGDDTRTVVKAWQRKSSLQAR